MRTTDEANARSATAGQSLRRSAPAVTSIVDQRLLRSLLDYSPPTLIVGMLVAAVVSFTIWRATAMGQVAYWMAGIVVISVARLLVVYRLKRRLNDQNAQRVGRFYAVTAAVGGASWAAIVGFDSPDHPMVVRLMILVVLVGMPVASLSANGIYRPIFFAFTLPLYLAMLYWAWRLAPAMTIEFALLATAYGALVAIIASRYGDSLRRAAMRDIENEMLLHEVGLMNDELQRMAYKDSLTGLSNRRSLEETTVELLQRRRHGDTLAIMLIDMDDFKSINDNLGHAAGDAALIELSRRIESCSRVREMLAHTQVSAARVGGDEFIVIYRLSQDAAVEPLAARILDALTAPLDLGGEQYQPGVSIGIALAPLHGNDMDSLLRTADLAMYEAKQAGGRRFVIAPPPVPATPDAQGS